MVTSKLTAAAVQAQITSQKQRLAALEANLRTMESGMDKHMVQVQLKYAHGYLESLQEQLVSLQGTSPTANDQFFPHIHSSHTTPVQGFNSGPTDGSASHAESAGHTGYAAAQTDSAAHETTMTAAHVACSVEAHPVALQDSNNSDDGEFTHEVYHEVESHDGTLVWDYERAAEAEAAVTAARAAAEAAAEQTAAAIAAAAIADHPQQAVVAGQGHKAAQLSSKPTMEDNVSAGDCSLVDEDDWVCLQDVAAAAAAAAQDSTGGSGHGTTARKTGWAGVWSWGK